MADKITEVVTLLSDIVDLKINVRLANKGWASRSYITLQEILLLTENLTTHKRLMGVGDKTFHNLVEKVQNLDSYQRLIEILGDTDA